MADEAALALWAGDCRLDPVKFVKQGFAWGEGELAGWKGPDVWQEETLEALGREVRKRKFDGVHAVEPVRIATASGHGIGKTALTAWIILWIMTTRPRCKGTVTANTLSQLETKTWAELAKWKKRFVAGHWFNMTMGKMSMRMSHRADPDNWRCDAQTCKEENSEAFAGQHAESSTSFYLFDEGSAVPDIIYDVAEGGLTDGEPMMMIFGNPTRNTGRFREIFGKLRHRWICRQIDSRDCRLPNKEKIRQDIEDHGEDSDYIRVRVRGVFPQVGSLQFISSDVIDEAAKREWRDEGSWLVFGVDVARFGDDATVIAVRKGRDAKSLPWKVMRNADTMTVAAAVVDLAALYRPRAIFVDGGGVGGGVVDRLRFLGQPVHDVQFGSAPDRLNTTGGHQYANKRAEMWGMMREWLKGGAIPPGPELRADLECCEYSYAMKNGVECIQLEKKDDMKKRGLASPDFGDALCFLGSTGIMTPTGERRIDEIEVGDLVRTPFGDSEVALVWRSLADTLTTARFSNGVELVGKGEHKIFVWGDCACRLDALSPTVAIEPYSRLRFALWRAMSMCFIEARNIGFKRAVDIIARERRLTASAFFIGAFGLSAAARFQRALSFIIRMAIGATTPLRTWSLSSDPAIAPLMFEGGLRTQIMPPVASGILSGQDWRPLSGMRVRRDLSGIPNMGSGLWKDENQSARRARDAERRSGRFSQKERDSAQNPVSGRKRIFGSSPPVEHVIGAARILWRTVIGPRRVVPVSVRTESAPPTPVYNLTLRDHNAYYANGVLAYNCLTFAYPVGEVEPQKRRGNRPMYSYEYNPFAEMDG